MDNLNENSNLQDEMQKIYDEVDEGKLSVAEAMQQSNALTAQMVEMSVTDKANAVFTKALSERDAQTVQQDWLKLNPEFTELQQSGQLEAIKQANPMHDDFSAYHQLKADRACQDSSGGGAQTEQKTLPKEGSAASQKASMLKAFEGAA